MTLSEQVKHENIETLNTTTASLMPWEYLDEKEVVQINTQTLAQCYKHESHFFYTSAYMAGYFYNGQHWERMQGDKQREAVIRNKLTNMLGVHYSAKRVTNALRIILDTSLDDTKLKAFQANPNMISFKNLAIDVTTLETMPNEPNLYLLNGIDYPIDTSGKMPQKHLTFIQDMLGDSATFLTEYIGYMFKRTYSPFQTFIIIQGGAGTGKSTLLNMITSLIGEDKISAVGLQDLATDKFASFGLVDKLANIRSDISSLMIAKPDLIKQVTGDDTITVERKGEQAFSYLSYAKLLFTANTAPNFAQDMGIERRAKLLKVVGRTHSDADQIGKLDLTPFIKERPQMAYYVIQQYAKAEDAGQWTLTDTIKNDTQEWLYQGDDIAQWADEHLQPEDGRRPKTSDIYFYFKQDMQEAGFKSIPSSKTLLKELRRLGYIVKQSGAISAEDKGGVTSRLMDHVYTTE